MVGGTYQTIPPNPVGHRWSQEMQLFLGIHNSQLRYFTSDGQFVLTPVEAAQEAQQEAEASQQQNSRLAAKLREFGVDPGTL